MGEEAVVGREKLLDEILKGEMEMDIDVGIRLGQKQDRCDF